MKKKRIVTIFMALTLMLVLSYLTSSNVFANTQNITEEQNNDIEILEVKYVSEEFVESQLDNVTRASENVPKGRSYLGNFSFFDKNNGLTRYYDGNNVRLIIAWKAADSGGDVDLVTSFFGKQYIFRCANDSDGKDANGYYYIEGLTVNLWWNKYSNITYDAITRQGWNPPGYSRSANVHTWVDVW